MDVVDLESPPVEPLLAERAANDDGPADALRLIG